MTSWGLLHSMAGGDGSLSPVPGSPAAAALAPGVPIKPTPQQLLPAGAWEAKGTSLVKLYKAVYIGCIVLLESSPGCPDTDRDGDHPAGFSSTPPLALPSPDALSGPHPGLGGSSSHPKVGRHEGTFLFRALQF